MSKIKSWVKAHWKAIGGALAGLAASFIPAWDDGAITALEWRGIILAVLAGAGIVYTFPANKEGA